MQLQRLNTEVMHVLITYRKVTWMLTNMMFSNDTLDFWNRTERVVGLSSRLHDRTVCRAVQSDIWCDEEYLLLHFMLMLCFVFLFVDHTLIWPCASSFGWFFSFFRTPQMQARNLHAGHTNKHGGKWMSDKAGSFRPGEGLRPTKTKEELIHPSIHHLYTLYVRRLILCRVAGELIHEKG